MGRDLYKLVGAVILLLILPLFTGGRIQAEEWWEQAAEQSKDEFKAVIDSVSETVDKIDKAQQELESFEEWARKNLKGDELSGVLDKVRQVRESLEEQSKPLRLFQDHAGKVGEVITAAWDLKQLADDARARRGGQSAAALHVAAWLMNEYGDKVPIPLVGDALKAYGQITQGILDATDQIAKTIDQNRNQNMFGAGTYGGMDNPLYQELVKQYGKDLADAYTYAPCRVPYVYAPIGQDPGWCLVWNPDTQKWQKVDQPAAALEQIYRDRALVKGHTNPDLLVGLAGLKDAIDEHQASAVDVLGLWEQMRKPLMGNARDAFDAVNRKHDYDLWRFLDDPEGFRARYIYDSAFRGQVHQYMVETYEELSKRGVKATAIEDWAKRNGVALPKPQDQPKPSDQGGQLSVDQQGAVTPAGPVELSIAFLVDCSGSMDGEKIEAAKRAVASSVQRTNDGKTEWAVLGFGGCSFWEEIGFTQDTQAVVGAANSLSTSGDTPLTFSMYKALSYLSRKAHGKAGRLVILCDGQDNCSERNSVSREEAMAGLRTIVRSVAPSGAAGTQPR
ncbi:MAG: VWA domain-containing protein [Armatimonadota bacterium]